MKQDLPNDEIHALHIVDLGVVAGKRPEDISQILVSLGPHFEKRVFGKSSAEVSLDLRGRLRNGLEFRKALEVLFAFGVFTQDGRLEHSLLKLVQVDFLLLASRSLTCRLILLQLLLLFFELLLILAKYLLLQHGVREPLDSLLAPEFVIRVLLACALDLRFCFFQLGVLLFREGLQLVWRRKGPRHLDRALLVFSCQLFPVVPS